MKYLLGPIAFLQAWTYSILVYHEYSKDLFSFYLYFFPNSDPQIIFSSPLSSDQIW